jgi:hypothetical protein
MALTSFDGNTHRLQCSPKEFTGYREDKDLHANKYFSPKFGGTVSHPVIDEDEKPDTFRGPLKDRISQVYMQEFGDISDIHHKNSLGQSFASSPHMRGSKGSKGSRQHGDTTLSFLETVRSSQNPYLQKRQTNDQILADNLKHESAEIV